MSVALISVSQDTVVSNKHEERTRHYYVIFQHYFPPWSSQHQAAFDRIKRLVTSPVYLTTIDHDNPGDNHIFLTTDASDLHTGAVLSWGPDWKMARPVAFDSAPLRNAELNYPVHEKELFAIICALKKWRCYGRSG